MFSLIYRCVSSAYPYYNNLYWDCDDLPVDRYNPVYEIKIDVYREQTPPTCHGDGSSGLVYWADITTQHNVQIDTYLKD